VAASEVRRFLACALSASREGKIVIFHIFQLDADFALGACIANRPHKADVSLDGLSKLHHGGGLQAAGALNPAAL
jgi:hypothetical protein